MVYCGKPSRSCHACRERKSRCDANPGGCGQCKRVGRVCPGYRSQIDIIFKDESQNIARKAHRKNAASKSQARLINAETESPKSTTSTTPTSDTESVTSTDLEWFRPTTLPTVSLPFQNVDESATNYFVRNFVQNAQSSVMGFYGIVESLFALDKVDKSLEVSLNAASLASFNRIARSPEVMLRARQQYLKALQLVNTSLQSPETAKQDSTLVAVLVLGIFEMVCGTSTQSADAWTRHIRGTAALLELRGVERLKTRKEQMLFSAIVQKLRIASVVHGLNAIPPFIVSAVVSLMDAPDGMGAAMKNHLVMIEVNQLLARRDGHDPDMMQDTIIKLLECDTYLRATYLKDISGLQQEVSDPQAEPETKRPDGDVYQSLGVANLWNAVRALRIYLNMGIIERVRKLCLCSTPDADTTMWIKQHQTSLAVAKQMHRDIMDSFPQILAKGRIKSPQREDSADVARCLEVIYPLWLAGSMPMDITSDADREYCAEQLEYIGRASGIQQATALARLVRNPKPTTMTLPTAAPT